MRLGYESDDAELLPFTVHEMEPEAVDTGLLNANGEKIYRTKKTRPIGFDLSGQK